MKAKSIVYIRAAVDSFGLAEGTLVGMQSAQATTRANCTAMSRNAYAQKLISSIPSSSKKWKSL
jgi:hypothetical protein